MVCIRRKFIFHLLLVLSGIGNNFLSQNDNPVLQLLNPNGNAVLTRIMRNPDLYKIQIIYTQINRDVNGKPTFKNYYYHTKDTFFYCASMVKLPVSILALQKLNELPVGNNGINLPMISDSTAKCHRKISRDTSSASGYPELGNYIRKMLLVSDNSALGRVLNFTGYCYVNDELHKRQINSFIIHNFDGLCSYKDQFFTPPVIFYSADGTKLFTKQAEQCIPTIKNPHANPYTGSRYIDKSGKRIPKPKDFSEMNYLSLSSVHELMRMVIFKNEIKSEKQFNLNDNQYQFLLTALWQKPRHSEFPKYNSKKFHDSYKKYFIWGDTKDSIPDNGLRIYNIVGQSYGFMADCAYIVDPEKGVEFLLSAVIFANEDGIMNDGKYEYKSVGFPFLAEIGRRFYTFELQRKKGNTTYIKYPSP